MNRFSETSLRRLRTCHPKLIELCHLILREMDISILCGHRGEDAQNQAYYDGKSGVKWPDSWHNKVPSRAVDIAPYPIDWEDIGRFKAMGELAKAIAAEEGIRIRWGGDWRMRDYPHIELHRDEP